MEGDTEKKEENMEQITENNSQKSSRNASKESDKSTNSKLSENNKENSIQPPTTSQSSSRNASSESTDTTASNPKNSQQGSWWGTFSNIAKEVGNAVVEGVKEEIAEIKEDIETVAELSATAGSKAVELSKEMSEKARVGAEFAAEAGKEFVTKDMKEFGKVLEAETMESINDAKVVSSTVGTALGSWMSTISKAVASNAAYSSSNTDGDEEGVIIGKNKSKVSFVSAFDARLHTLRTDPGTYCVEPIEREDYDLWRETFDLDNQTTKKMISDLLVNSQEIRSLYTKLVPSAVIHQEFWQRYFYKLDALERAERKRTLLMERAEKSGTEEEEDLSWGDEDESEEKKQETETVEAEESETQTKVDEEGKEESLTTESPVIVEKEKGEKSAAEKQLESDDWEKEFDIEMTEEEIKAALKNGGQDEDLDGWD